MVEAQLLALGDRQRLALNPASPAGRRGRQAGQRSAEWSRLRCRLWCRALLPRCPDVLQPPAAPAAPTVVLTFALASMLSGLPSPSMRMVTRVATVAASASRISLQAQAQAQAPGGCGGWVGTAGGPEDGAR